MTKAPDRFFKALRAHVSDARRVEEYYAPLAAHCQARLSRQTRRPLVVGVQGPQGGGKSSLTGALVAAFGDLGAHALSVSVDDFYLTNAEQQALAQRHDGDPSMLYRGYPGTHDVALGDGVLARLVALGPGEETGIPVYDKSAFGGRGDRAPESSWRRAVGPVDILFLEGWMLGFSAAPDADIEPSLVLPNRYLPPYRAWSQRLDLFIHLHIPTRETITLWRIDAERARRERGEPALSDNDARDYIERFLPGYRVYVPRLASHPPCSDILTVVLGPDRHPVSPIPYPSPRPAHVEGGAEEG